MAKTRLFTPEEENQIFQAASRTWGEIESDAAEIGASSISGAIERVLDADRIVTIGKLDPTLYRKIVASDFKKTNSWMKKNRASWY